MCRLIALNSAVPARPNHSKITISVVTTFTPFSPSRRLHQDGGMSDDRRRHHLLLEVGRPAGRNNRDR
jgi:hypothetical protein